MTATEDARAEEDLTLSQRIAKARVMHSFLPDDDSRSKNEYVADELEAAGYRLTTPPTDDERDALIALLDDAADRWATLIGNHAHRTCEARDECMAGRCNSDITPNGYGFTRHTPSRVEYIADAILANFRRQGPITDEWEYGCQSSSHSGFMRSVFEWGDREDYWREHLAECPSPAPVRRRKAGPWEPVEAARDAS